MKHIAYWRSNGAWGKALLAALTLVGAVHCGGSRVSTDELSLQGRLLADPQERESRLALAQLAEREGLPAKALREYLILKRREQLGTHSRAALAALLHERAKVRISVRDSLALKDLLLAQKLGKTVDSSLWFEAYSNSAVALLRHSSRFERNRAEGMLRKLGDTPLAMLRRSHEELSDKSEDDLLSLWRWFDENGAKRQALRILERYVKNGGRQELAARRWHELHHWWYGDTRPALPSDVSGQAPLPSVDTRFALERQEAARVWQAEESVIPEWAPSLSVPTLEKIRDSYRQDSALAGREARNFVDTSIHGASEMAVVAELFYRLGDLHRAHEWTEILATLSPDTPAYAMSACLGNIAVGEVDRAQQWLVRAASTSGDPGQYWAAGASSFRRFGHPLAAIAAGRKALDLSSAGEDLLILLELSQAQMLANRGQDASESTAVLRRRLAVENISPEAYLDQEDTAKPKTLLGVIWK